MSTAKQQETDVLPQGNQPQNPLERMSTLLSGDMLEVNKCIIEHLQSEVPMIPQIATYLIAAGGKRIRPLLTLACTRIYGYDGDRPFNLAASVEFIHTATLLHDDVVDESDQRRGKKAANLVFGNQATVLVGDFLFSRAFQLMVADGSIDVLRILSDASAIISQGEVKQLSIANNLDTSMEDYIDVIKAKTAALFSASTEIGPVIAGAQDDQIKAMHEYGLNLGIAFQITDDILDYSSAQEKLGKDVGDDFYEGKITAPVLFALQKADPDERAFMQNTIGDKKFKDGDFEFMQSVLEKHNALEDAIAMAQHYGELAKKSLSKTPESELRDLLDQIVDFTINRSF